MPDIADRRLAGILTSVARYRVPLGFVVGVIAFGLTRPTWNAVAVGGVISAIGEGVRFWAAGHLDKGREVTVSGPYRWVRHPLYLGSAILGTGFVIASGSASVGVLVATYLGLTLTAAIRTEDAWLRSRFGNEYERYREGQIRSTRPFSLSRAQANREYRAVLGMVAVIGALAWRILSR